MTVDEFISEWHNESPTMIVHTSGSTGKPKDIVIEKKRMVASANMTCDALDLHSGDTALLCMPLDYIAGKMLVVRSIVRNMKLIAVEPSSHPLKSFVNTTFNQNASQKIDFAAFVPLQVIKTLEDADERKVFEQIGNVIIGGGAIDDKLEQQLNTFSNNIYSTYGMTETLSHIALRRISGPDASLWYTPMKGISISLSDEDCLAISAPELCSEKLITNDIAEINSQGQFRILGRKDNIINTGGIKVQIEEVERVLKAKGVEHCQITSVSDSVFGEKIIALIPEDTVQEELKNMAFAIASLPKYWQPKEIVRIASLPMTETGKPNRAEAKRLAVLKLQ